MSNTLALNQATDSNPYYSTHALNGNDTQSLLKSAQLNWEYVSSPVEYETELGKRISRRNVVLYRSDTMEEVSTVSKKFRPVQPRQLVDFYSKVCQSGNFQLDALGCVGNGARIWGLAKGVNECRIQGQDVIVPNLFFVTGNDGSLSTQIKFLSRRLVCNNQLDAAISEDEGWKVVIPHSTGIKIDAIADHFDGLPKIWARFEDNANQLADKKLTDKQAFEYFYELYVSSMDSDATIEKKTTRMMELYKHHPTQQTRSTRGTAWGVVNAVTLFEDHFYGNKQTTQESRFKNAMLGNGEKNKRRVWEMALAA